MVICWSLAVPLLCSGLDTKFCLFLLSLSGAERGEEGKDEQCDSVCSMPSVWQAVQSLRFLSAQARAVVSSELTGLCLSPPGLHIRVCWIPPAEQCLYVSSPSHLFSCVAFIMSQVEFLEKNLIPNFPLWLCLLAVISQVSEQLPQGFCLSVRLCWFKLNTADLWNMS